MATCPMRRNTPPNWQAPYDAFEAKYAAEAQALSAVVLGVQDRGGDRETALRELGLRLSAPGGPDVVEQGWHDDTLGAHTRIVFAYWRDPAICQTWLAHAETQAWLAGASGLIGRFVESAVVNPRALDTLIADPKVNWGLAKLADSVEVTPYHAYWGGTRDRILISETDDLANPVGSDLIEPAEREAPIGIDQIVDVVLPHNAVMARGGPDWSKCPTDERLEFRNSVYPAYVAGGRYLRDNPVDAGCYAAYRVQETDAAGRDVERNHLIAYFVELSHLERWTKSHPTHVEIYQRFLKMLHKIGRMPDMNLYHEVSVIAQGGLRATYANCLPSTGFLRFGQARD
jgi:aldoxime dehydratase